MVRVFAPIPKVKGSNLMGGVVCAQQWYVDRIFSYQIPKIGLWVVLCVVNNGMLIEYFPIEFLG
jgi:hypothetical protein